MHATIDHELEPGVCNLGGIYLEGGENLLDGLETRVLGREVWIWVCQEVIEQESSQRLLHEFTIGRVEDEGLGFIQGEPAVRKSG